MASGYLVGLKALKSLCNEQKPLGWQKAKLTPELFKGDELAAFNWVNNHVTKFHAVPNLDTLLAQFPELKEFDVPEPTSYYVDLLENRYGYETINNANIKSQELLKEDKTNVDLALKVMQDCMNKITQQKYRTRILDLGQEGPKLVVEAYNNVHFLESKIVFGWDYVDGLSSGAMPGDLMSFVGRPQAGKTFLGLYCALINWLKGRSVLFVSMEMNPLAIAQRTTAMYAHTTLTGLKTSQFSTKQYDSFVGSMVKMKEIESKFYVVDGNLAANVEEIYSLAAQLNVDMVCIDGAYLVKHKNVKLDRFTRAAENTELMKQMTSDLAVPTFASWQFNREAAKKMKKGDKSDNKVDLEDIGMSDAIGQCSSVVLGLFQEDTVETLYQRTIDVMKGRNGEVGKFAINWDFWKMDFSQVKIEIAEANDKPNEYL